VHSLGRIEEPVRLSHTILRIVSLLLLMAVVGGGFVWWQDQQPAHQGPGQPRPGARRSRSADGTTQIHPLDEPEDQAVAQARRRSAAGAGQRTSTGRAARTVAPANTPAQRRAPVAWLPGAPAPSLRPAAAPARAPAPAAPAPVGRQRQVIQFTADCWTQVTMATARCCSAASSARATAS
jgi:cytoskeleton protein RodZ